PTYASDTSKWYSGNAVITGDLHAGSIKQGPRGSVRSGSNITTETGQDLGDRPGNILTGSYQGPTGSSLAARTAPYTNASTGCSWCGMGATAAGGQVGGSVTVQSGYAPATVPFPVVNYPQFKTSAQTNGTDYASCSTLLTALTANSGRALTRRSIRRPARSCL